MATFKRERQNLVPNGKVGDVDVMVTNTMKKLALQKEKTTTTSSGQPHEIMRPKASIYDIQRKFSSIEENQTNSSKSSSILQSPTTTSSLSMEIEFRSHQQLGTTVDDMVNNTLKKLEKKKSLVETPTDDNHDKEGNILRSKTSVAEFRNRFSDSSERGKEGYNSLETTPIGKAYKYLQNFHTMNEKISRLAFTKIFKLKKIDFHTLLSETTLHFGISNCLF